MVKYLPKPTVPPEFEQIKVRLENFKRSLKNLKQLNIGFHQDVKLRLEQLLYYESNLNEHMRENTELVENLKATGDKYDDQIDLAENKFYPDNLLKLKAKLDALFEFLVEKTKQLEAEQKYLNMYKTLNFPLIFNCQKDDSIKDIFTFDTSSANIVYYNIISICNISDKKFYDQYFPPVDKSLFSGNNATHNKPKLKWLRPEALSIDYSSDEANWCIYKNPSENDLKQGLLGNYWLLSSK